MARKGLFDKPHDVYRVRDAGGQLLYVGCSMNAFKRVKQHKYEHQPWFPIATTVDVEQYQNFTTARYVEARAIATEGPLWNQAQEAMALTRRPKSTPEPIEAYAGIPIHEFWAGP